MLPSIVPTSFRPAFVGSKGLGSGINPSMIRKTQIVQFWLDQEYAGVTIRQFQGSPSYSGASAGIHGGPGDFQDFVLVDSLGRSPATKVWVACSAMFRLLDCLSYVRGSDVNADGRKDDSFMQHIHVGDREGGGKVVAATIQISQYLAHQNGLMGGHPDLEATVSNPLTLATYTDREFADRYQSLSGVSMTLDAHTEPTPTTQEDDMRDFVAACYRLYLGREGSTAELDGWAISSVQNGWTAKQVLPMISDSPEGRARATTLTFQTSLGRAPSAEDIAFWSKQGGYYAIVNGIANSDEAIADAAKKKA
jgi:hypothetical protein